LYNRVSDGELNLLKTIYSPVGPHANFGISVDISSDWIVVGANAYDYYTGVVVLYKRARSNVWVEHGKLLSPLSTAQGFGYSVSINGDVIVVGTAVDGAFIYEYIQGSWVLTQSLSNGDASSGFGKKADVSGDYIIVGAAQYRDTEGAAYVYHRTAPRTWELVHTLASEAGVNTQYGFSVSIYNTTLAVGAVGFRKNVYKSKGEDTADNTGWVYTYEIVEALAGPVEPTTEDTTRRLTSTIAPLDIIQSPVGRGSYFGASLSLCETGMIVGANGYRK
jgi:hypothetical protein